MSRSSDRKGGSTGSSDLVFLGLPGVYVANGDHIAHFFRGDKERLTVLGPFIKAGLEAGDQCVVMTEAADVSRIKAGLQNLGVDVESVLASGQLLISHGRAETAEMSTLFDEFISRARAAGREVIRIGGDMTWVLGKMALPERQTEEGARTTAEMLLEWEAFYDRYVGQRASFVALCQYDHSRFDGSAIMYALETHPLSIIGHIVQENPYYQEPDEILKRLDSIDV